MAELPSADGGARLVPELLWALTLLAATALVTWALGLPPGLRLPLLVAFLALAPGLAWVRLLRVGSWVAELALGLGVSVALDVLVPSALIYAGRWSPALSLSVLSLLTVAGAAAQIALGLGRRVAGLKGA